MSRFVSVSPVNPTQQRHELKHEESRLVLSVHLLLSVWWEDVVLTASRWIQVKDLLLFLSHLLTPINHTLRGLKKKTPWGFIFTQIKAASFTAKQTHTLKSTWQLESVQHQSVHLDSPAQSESQKTNVIIRNFCWRWSHLWGLCPGCTWGRSARWGLRPTWTLRPSRTCARRCWSAAWRGPSASWPPAGSPGPGGGRRVYSFTAQKSDIWLF